MDWEDKEVWQLLELKWEEERNEKNGKCEFAMIWFYVWEGYM